MMNQVASASSKSNSTCDSKNNHDNCEFPTCPKLQKKCTIESKICQELLKKKETSASAQKPKSQNSLCHFEPTDKLESTRNHFVFNKNYIKLDAFGFGMGNCCLQITYSSRDISEARFVYDSMSILGSPLAALMASTAVVDSVLIDWDVRLRLIEQSTDSRTRAENVTIGKG